MASSLSLSDHPSSEQLIQIKSTQDYIKTSKVQQILQEALAKVIQTKPQKFKQGLINILKSIQEKSLFYKKSDFENIYQNYHVFEGSNEVSYAYLMDGLEKVGVKYNKDEFLQFYPQFKLDKGVKKSDFVQIMESEYQKKIKI